MLKINYLIELNEQRVFTRRCPVADGFVRNININRPKTERVPINSRYINNHFLTAAPMTSLAGATYPGKYYKILIDFYTTHDATRVMFCILFYLFFSENIVSISFDSLNAHNMYSSTITGDLSYTNNDDKSCEEG